MAIYTNNSNRLATVVFKDGTSRFLLSGQKIVSTKKLERTHGDISVNENDEKVKEPKKKSKKKEQNIEQEK